MNIANFKGHILSDGEFLEYLDYALDAVSEFEAQADACCDALRKRAAALAS
ncbi:hypothetical protein [Caballeronia sp. LjRoot31]|uniref:hypothetical protein n=1 Tax=Caballeronia sp. LjRoot31 TaxID=3342324 RepID=UPI003ED13459